MNEQNESKVKLKFTYGHQFEPEKFSLIEILEICQEYEPDREQLEREIAQRFFASHSQESSDAKSASSNISKLAMNCYLSLRSYQLIADTEKSRNYNLTDLARSILAKSEKVQEVNQIFARHILTNLTGMSLLKAIEAINTRGDEPQLEAIAYELQEMGFGISPNAIYTSTMRKWLQLAGIFEREYEINWDKVSEILGINQDYIDQLYSLKPPQKYFLLAMIHLDIKTLTSWNQITKYATSVYKIRFPSKTFVQQVINPLAQKGLIRYEKTTSGRGAKPNQVALTNQTQQELVANLLATIASQAEISETELNRSFADVLNDLDHNDKHIKGKALELLAIWMIRLTSLRFTKWRKRDQETGDGEVDVLAASDRFVYSRWQIQCKNTKKVDVDVLAKEIGMTFVTGADVVMIVTTGEFTRSAYQYAYRMMEVSRYYMILIERDDIEAIKQDKTNIIQILDRKAQRVFAKRELAMTDDEIDAIETGENW